MTTEKIERMTKERIAELQAWSDCLLCGTMKIKYRDDHDVLNVIGRIRSKKEIISEHEEELKDWESQLEALIDNAA